MSDTKYISCVDTSKIIRKKLKQLYPDTKFSVRSDQYSGGASIRVNWKGYPAQKEVERHLKMFEGASFDGMIDLKSYHDTEFEGQRVHFGSDYVFCEQESIDIHLEKDDINDQEFFNSLKPFQNYRILLHTPEFTSERVNTFQSIARQLNNHEDRNIYVRDWRF